MSVTEQEKLIESMASLDEKGQTYLMGVMAGLVAAQEQQTSSVSCADTFPKGEGTTGCCGKCGGGEKDEEG